jgi:hypothetical protein
MKSSWRLACAALVFILLAVIEIGIWYSPNLHNILNYALNNIPLASTGSYGQAMDAIIFFLRLVCVLVNFVLATGVYKLISDEY